MATLLRGVFGDDDVLRAITMLSACVADAVEQATVLVVEGESMWKLDAKHLGGLLALCKKERCPRDEVENLLAGLKRLPDAAVDTTEPRGAAGRPFDDAARSSL